MTGGQRRAQPYVVADMRPDPRTGQILTLVIENTGQTLARNVQVSFDPPLESITFPDRFTEASGPTEGFAAIPPGRRYVYLLDMGFRRAEGNLPDRYSVRITADGPFGPLEPLEYEIDLVALKHLDGRAEGVTKDVVDALRKIEDRLGRVGGLTGFGPMAGLDND